MRMLHAGGNAVDAGVASLFAGSVSEFSHFGFGGEAPILIRTPDGDVVSIGIFDTVDPLEFDLQVESSAPPGEHMLSGNLTYFYCIKASGFCAPKKTTVEIPLLVR